MQAVERGRSLPFPSSSQKPIEKIAILVAMPEEAQPVINALNLERFDAGLEPHINLESYRGTCAGRSIYLIVNGVDPIYGVAQVGTDVAVLSTFETIKKLEPDTIISAGTAGGYAEKGAHIGDVYVASGNFVFHDRRIPCGEKYYDYGQGFYPCLSAPAMINALQLKSGIISTGNSLSLSSADQEVLQKNGAVAKDMEVAAIANIARQFGVRVMAVKAITNIAKLGADAGEQFENNFSTAVTALANKIPKIIHYLMGKTPSQLEVLLGCVE